MGSKMLILVGEMITTKVVYHFPISGAKNRYSVIPKLSIIHSAVECIAVPLAPLVLAVPVTM